MNRNIAQTVVRLAVVGAALVGLAGCEDSSAPPPPASGSSGSGGGGGGPLSHMSEQPQSMLGKSAQSGKNVGRDIQQSQAREMGMAQEITGEAAAFDVAGLAFSAPTEWTKVAAAPPRAAEFKVGEGGDGGGSAGVVFFFFGNGQGGNVTQNLDRWRRMVLDDANQPAEQDVVKRTVNGMAVTLVSSEGFYQEGMPGQPATPRRGYAFRGAIIEGPQGNIFVRMVGPKNAVLGAEGAYTQMIEGARRK